MNFKNCYILSIFLCLFLTSIPLHAVLYKSPYEYPQEAKQKSTAKMLYKSFGGYALGLITSGLILTAFCNAPKAPHDSTSYMALGLLSSFAGGSLANFFAHRYPKQTAIACGYLASLATITLGGLAFCYAKLDLLPISDSAGFFTNYPPPQQ